MPTVVLKNLPEPLHARLKERALRHHRSLNKETIALIESALGTSQVPPVLSPPLRLRGGFRPSIEDIEAAIADGRD